MSLKNDARLEMEEYSPRETVSTSAEKSQLVESSSPGKEDLVSTEHSPVLFPQILGGGVSALVQVGLGMVAGYSGVTIPQLTSNNSTTSGIAFDDHQVALFSSLVYLTATAGCLIGILPMVRYGQRTTMLLSLPILLLGWITLSVSTTVAMIQASRCLVGLTIGVIESASYQYTTEISHSSIRGMMVGVIDTMRQLGVLLVYSLGATTLSWQQISLVCGCTTVPPVFVALIFLPNSPRWLVTQGRMKEASRSLAFYRGSNHNIDAELTAITRQVEDMSGKTSLSFVTQLKVILQKKTMKVIVFLTFLFLAAQFTGNIVVIAYIVPILEVANISMNSYMAAIVVGGIRVLGTICSLFFVDHFGRKPALLVSFLVCATSLAGLGTFFFVKSRYDNVQGIDWMPLTCLIFFTFFTCVAHPTLNLVRGELLPTAVRSAAMPFLCSVLFGGLFLASQTFPMMTSSLGTFGTFWMYGAMCILVLAVTILVIPETRNENLENITLERRKR